MTSNEMFARCDLAGAELAEPLFNAFADAAVTAEDFMAPRRRSGNNYAWLESGVIRVDVREHLVEEGLPDGWELAGKPELSGQLILASPLQALEIRVLKESRVTKNGVPHAGRNRGRRAKWSNPWQKTLFEAVGLDAGRGLEAMEHNELLLLWNYDVEVGFSLRLVHPIEPGMYKGTVRYDYSSELVVGSTLQERRRYDPDASEEYQIREANVEADDYFSEGTAGA